MFIALSRHYGYRSVGAEVFFARLRSAGNKLFSRSHKHLSPTEPKTQSRLRDCLTLSPTADSFRSGRRRILRRVVPLFEEPRSCTMTSTCRQQLLKKKDGPLWVRK